MFPADNTALLGAMLALFTPPSEAVACCAVRSRTHHVPLNEDPGFMEIYVDEMSSPAGVPGSRA